MNLSLIKIQTYFPDFNVKPITPEDFWRVIAQEKIIVKQMPLLVDGYYTRREGRDYILINSRLRGISWMQTALHELYHYLFDVHNDGRPVETFYRRGRNKDSRECRADAFAVIGLLPWPELVKMTATDIEDFPCMAELVRSRIVVRTEFGQ